MATRKSTKAVATEEVIDEVEETVEAELSVKQIINEGVARVVEATDPNGQHFRYKAMRAIAFQAFTEAIDAGDFDALVERAIDNADDLPSGWELARGEKEEAPVKPVKAKAVKAAAATAEKPAAKTVKAPAKKAPAKAATAAAPRKRPAR